MCDNEQGETAHLYKQPRQPTNQPAFSDGLLQLVWFGGSDTQDLWRYVRQACHIQSVALACSALCELVEECQALVWFVTLSSFSFLPHAAIFLVLLT